MLEKKAFGAKIFCNPNMRKHCERQRFLLDSVEVNCAEKGLFNRANTFAQATPWPGAWVELHTVKIKKHFDTKFLKSF